MDFALTEEHRMVQQMVRDFANKEVAPVIKDYDRKGDMAPFVLPRMGELGILGICFPVKYGGQGMDYLSYIIAVEEIARVDGSHAATLAAGNSLGIGPIYYFGTQAQKEKYLCYHRISR
mgnify:CR=1 FL=1